METPVGAPLKVKFRLEITKLREMTFKEKIEYIWEYYKYFIIGIAIVLIICGSLINSFLINPRPETTLFVSWSAGFAFEEQLDELADVLHERVLGNAKNEKVDVAWMLSMGDDPSAQMARINQLVAMVASGVIDIFTLNRELIDEYSASGFLRPMDEVLAEVQRANPGVYEKIRENLIYAMYESEEGNFSEKIMGISVGSSPLLSELEFFEQELYFSLSITSKNVENVVRALIVFFE